MEEKNNLLEIAKNIQREEPNIEEIIEQLKKEYRPIEIITLEKISPLKKNILLEIRIIIGGETKTEIYEIIRKYDTIIITTREKKKEEILTTARKQTLEKIKEMLKKIKKEITNDTIRLRTQYNTPRGIASTTRKEKIIKLYLLNNNISFELQPIIDKYAPEEKEIEKKIQEIEKKIREENKKTILKKREKIIGAINSLTFDFPREEYVRAVYPPLTENITISTTTETIPFE